MISKHLIKILVLSSLAFITNINSSFAEIYRWEDMEGNIRYSDIPPEPTEGVNIQEVNLKNKGNYNQMDGNTKLEEKRLIENVDDGSYQKELDERTQEYKKEKDRRSDEDVSNVIKQYKNKPETFSNESNDNSNNTSDNKPSAFSNQGDTQQQQTTPSNNSSGSINNTNNGNKQTVEPQGKLQENLIPPSQKEIRQAKNCAIAKHNLDKLNQSDIIISKNNKMQKLSKSQLDQKIKQTKGQIAFYC